MDTMDTMNITERMRAIGEAARAAQRELALASAEAKNKALIAAAESLRARKDEILAANAKDMAAATEKGLSAAMLDRLELNEDRIEGMAVGLVQIAALDDPIGTLLEEKERPNGLIIQRVRVPLGVIGVIYESRPNVTADAGSLCLKAGNAAILRGGSESFYSSHAIMASLARSEIRPESFLRTFSSSRSWSPSSSPISTSPTCSIPLRARRTKAM